MNSAPSPPDPNSEAQADSADSQPTVRARRLSREDRYAQLLDVAVELIIDRGLSRFNLEDVANRAGVSTPLIYKYFPKREDLLKAVLEREYLFLRGSGLQSLPADRSFRSVIRSAISRSFRYLYERGPIMRLLASDRAVTDLVQDQDRNERGQITSYFVDGARKEFGVSLNEATIISILTVNAPILSARALRRAGISDEEAADVWYRFLLGGWAALEQQAGERDVASPPENA
jgi:AcrR family transcriptional regulator